MTEDRTARNVLARITDHPQLARAVPLLQPEVLHAVIAHVGLHDCGELLTLATPEQLSAVLDLDLWKAERAGTEERFDAARFCEWLEVLVDAGAAIAAERLAQMDASLVVAGLSPNIEVFDLAVFAPVGEETGVDPVMNAGRERGVHAEIGGYVVVARRTDAWDVIVDALVAFAEDHAAAFHRVMRECRKLTNAGWELDGLDNLLSNEEQAGFDLATSREERRDRHGYLSPQQAHVFLTSARRLSLAGDSPAADVVFAAYLRSLAPLDPASDEPATPDAQVSASAADVDPSAAAAVVEMLRDAGVLAEPPRALLTTAEDGPESNNAAFNRYMQANAGLEPDAWVRRNQELAFLANALVAGCSVQGRAFTRREAMDAVAATCNLGLEHWPSQWPASSTQTLVSVFQVGWSALHREVSMAAADALLKALSEIQVSDRDLQLGLHVLRRDLRKQREAGTPWHARDRFEVLASFDLAVWAALLALFDECPVMLANVHSAGGQRPYTVKPSEFQFIASRAQLVSVKTFLQSLADLLTR